MIRKERRSGKDRRSEQDRRKVYVLGYERSERRCGLETLVVVYP